MDPTAVKKEGSSSNSEGTVSVNCANSDFSIRIITNLLKFSHCVQQYVKPLVRISVISFLKRINFILNNNY